METWELLCCLIAFALAFTIVVGIGLEVIGLFVILRDQICEMKKSKGA